jgi:septum site-determining protein MinC
MKIYRRLTLNRRNRRIAGFLPTVTIAARPRPSLRFRGKSFLALVLAPVVPMRDWLEDLDALTQNSPGFLSGRPVILDVSALKPSKSELKFLLAAMRMRDIRVAGLEGAAPAFIDADMPQAITGGELSSLVDRADLDGAAPLTREPGEAAPAPTLTIEDSIRSGQSILHRNGDVTVLGSVASGAEIVAGGSIHIYGSLRGRAVAGCMGNPTARIFCRKFVPELVAVNGLYKTADDLGAKFRNLPVQISLKGDSLIVAPQE